MAQYSVTTGLTALAASTAKTMIEFNPDANTPGELIALTVSSSYLTTATPIGLQVELCTYTASGTGTGATIKRVGQGQGTGTFASKVNDTVEPAGASVVHGWDLVLPGDRLDYLWPLGRELFLNTSSFNGIRLTATAIASCRVTAWVEF